MYRRRRRPRRRFRNGRHGLNPLAAAVRHGTANGRSDELTDSGMLSRIPFRMADAERNDRNAIRAGPRRREARHGAPYAATEKEPRLRLGRDRGALDERAVLERRGNDDDQVDRADLGRWSGIAGRKGIAEPDRRIRAHRGPAGAMAFGGPLEFLGYRCYHHDAVFGKSPARDEGIDVSVDIVHPRPSGAMIHDGAGNAKTSPPHRPRNGARRRKCRFRNADDKCIAGALFLQ